MIQNYKCFSCNHTSKDPEEFLEFIGNVHIPGEGGIIGNNLSFGPNKQCWEPSEQSNDYEKGERKIVFESENFRLYSFVYCIPCTSRILGDHIHSVASKRLNSITKTIE